MDALADPPVARAEYLRALGLDVGRKTVLYGPHWSLLGRTATRRAARLVADVVRTLASLGQNVIVKPHRFSYTSVGGGGGDLARVFASLVADNVAIDPRVDDIPALAHADILVTDRSSRALSASLLGKPVIVFPVPSGTGTGADPDLPDFWGLLAPIVQVAADLPGLRARVREAAADSGVRGDERRRVASRFFSHYGEATGEAVRVLTELRRRPTRSR
jgi:CDP-glycerol glycerophosphotransferase (TagB/SpsB family)